MTFSPFVSFYNSIPSPSLDHVLYVHSRSYCTFPIIFLMHLSFVFFPAQHCIGGSLDPNVQHWDLHSLRPFHFPALLLHTLCFFFRHNTSSGDFWIQMITTGRCIQLGQVFISLRILWTPHSANSVFVKHNTASGDLWIQMTRCGTRIHLGFFISVRFFWTAHSPDFNE